MLFAVATVVALWLETEVRLWLPTGVLFPNLVLILAVDLGLKQHNGLAPALAFAMGYATDACAGTHLGVNAFMMTLIFLLSYELSRHVWVTGRVIGPLTVALADLLNTIGTMAITGGVATVSSIKAPAWRLILIQALITAAVAPLIFAILDAGKKSLRLPVRVAAE
jgi:cell shape-determining protein MreD